MSSCWVQYIGMATSTFACMDSEKRSTQANGGEHLLEMNLHFACVFPSIRAAGQQLSLFLFQIIIQLIYHVFT